MGGKVSVFKDTVPYPRSSSGKNSLPFNVSFMIFHYFISNYFNRIYYRKIQNTIHFPSEVDMIDDKTREEILMLWSQGESKSNIKRITGVSLPSIRRIIKESKLTEETWGNRGRIHLRFVLNFSRNTPAAWYQGSFQHLEGGVASWKYKEVLLKFLSPKCVKIIEQKLQAISRGRPEGRIFEVHVTDLDGVKVVEIGPFHARTN